MLLFGGLIEIIMLSPQMVDHDQLCLFDQCLPEMLVLRLVSRNHQVLSRFRRSFRRFRCRRRNLRWAVTVTIDRQPYEWFVDVVVTRVSVLPSIVVTMMVKIMTVVVKSQWKLVSFYL